jgi:hypothetical protein
MKKVDTTSGKDAICNIKYKLENNIKIHFGKERVKLSTELSCFRLGVITGIYEHGTELSSFLKTGRLISSLAA